MTSPEHDSAVRRLDAERVKRERLRERHKAAIGTSAESGSYGRLGAAGAHVAARETWLRWVDEHSYRGLNAGPFELLAEQLGPVALPPLFPSGGSPEGPKGQRRSESKPPQEVEAQDADDQDARRTRRLSRAAEAFRKRAEESERRWLRGLRDR